VAGARPTVAASPSRSKSIGGEQKGGSSAGGKRSRRACRGLHEHRWRRGPPSMQRRQANRDWPPVVPDPAGAVTTCSSSTSPSTTPASARPPPALSTDPSPPPHAYRRGEMPTWPNPTVGGDADAAAMARGRRLWAVRAASSGFASGSSSGNSLTMSTCVLISVRLGRNPCDDSIPKQTSVVAKHRRRRRDEHGSTGR
jgi:hypothetical protein